MSTIQIRLPFPPSNNHYLGYRVAGPKGGRQFVQHYLTAEAKQYHVDVQAAVLKRFGQVRATRARLHVVIEVHAPDRRIRDLDNIPKVLGDSLRSSRLIADDSQIDHIEVVRGAVSPPGYLDVTISRISEEPARQLELLKSGEA